MKNIIICCDGTNNKLAGDLTNVVRLFEVATKSQGQKAFYDPGVGTMAAPDQTSWLGKRWSVVKGLAFGDGLDENVFEAYRYLMNHYEHGDRVFLFGFSRGAFTVRVLAGMLYSVGLLNNGVENLLPYVWQHYLGIRILPDSATAAEKAAAEQHADETKVLRRSFTRSCPVAFLGLWDTVGSVGMYNANQAFPFTFDNPGVEIVRHAVSMDERRAGFRSNVFKHDDTMLAGGRKRVMNVWFSGVHSDVGGGYPWKESGLAMLAFQWMTKEAMTAGMTVDQDKLKSLLDGCPPSPTAKIHESLSGVWHAMEYLPAKRFNWATKETEWRYKPNQPRTMLESPAIHRSVIDRMRAISDYHPACLPIGMAAGEIESKFPIEEY